MPRVHDNLLSAVGRTPLVRVHGLGGPEPAATVLAKLEYLNPAGSVKDRTALAIIRAAERDGRLRPGGTILEATSGNTGIGLAWIGAILGYRVVIVLPEGMSTERTLLLRSLGAEVVRTPADDGMMGAIDHALMLSESDSSLFWARQGRNVANPEIHETTTGPEIWDDTGGEIHALVATTGTGGTISGAGRYLRGQRPDIELYGVEPSEAPVLNGGAWKPHKIQGITGDGDVPMVTDLDLLTEVLTVPEDRAIEVARQAIRTEGLLVGVSAGAALAAALDLAAQPRFAGRTIVTVLPDTAERYVSSELFDHVRS